MSTVQAIKKNLPALRQLADPCRLCPHQCSALRLKGQKGRCGAGASVAVYSYAPHHGEEPPLSGTRNAQNLFAGEAGGSGTIFFTHCNMHCVYCQNYAFSQESNFEEISIVELASRMLSLQRLGCYNINLVSPTHYVCQIVEALRIALEQGLSIPVVYNTGGYDNVEVIKLLDGIIDVYMPDMRYADERMAARYSSAPSYVEHNRLVVCEMYRQAGSLELDERGIATKGLLIRLLMLPARISGTVETLRFLRTELSHTVYLSVMSQYHPTYRAYRYPEMNRHITQEEYNDIVREVERLGFTNGWVQGYMTESDRFLGTNIRPHHR
jgi:putative pyruvate formate lyase activating enzyme